MITNATTLKAAYPVLVNKIIKEALGEDTTSTIQVVKDKDGNISEWVEETFDDESNLISKRADKYSFYPSGEIDIITQQTWDKEGSMTERQIKHYVNGKHPSVTASEGAPKEVK